MTIRVLQWYTGTIGCLQMRRILADPRYELVGAVVHHPEKAGVDVGSLLGGEAVGVRTTADVEEALGIDADCVLVNGLSWDPELMARILRSGKNVINILGGYNLNTPLTPEGEMLDEAARAGHVSITGGGNMPGLLQDVLPLVMSGYATDITRIWARERNCHADYASPDVLRMIGYGAEPGNGDAEAAAELARRQLVLYAQSAYLCAEALGVVLSDFALSNYETVLAEADIYLPAADFTIRRGTVAGSRLEYTGYVDGKPWHVLEMEFTAREGLGPGWCDDRSEPGFTVRVDGDPAQEVTWNFHGLPNLLRLNAARMVNMVGPIVAAEPGARTILDMPWVVGSGGRMTRAVANSGCGGKGLKIR